MPVGEEVWVLVQRGQGVVRWYQSGEWFVCLLHQHGLVLGVGQMLGLWISWAC